MIEESDTDICLVDVKIKTENLEENNFLNYVGHYVDDKHDATSDYYATPQA